jgi:hypothetical protein
MSTKIHDNKEYNIPIDELCNIPIDELCHYVYTYMLCKSKPVESVESVESVGISKDICDLKIKKTLFQQLKKCDIKRIIEISKKIIEIINSNIILERKYICLILKLLSLKKYTDGKYTDRKYTDGDIKDIYKILQHKDFKPEYIDDFYQILQHKDFKLEYIPRLDDYFSIIINCEEFIKNIKYESDIIKFVILYKSYDEKIILNIYKIHHNINSFSYNIDKQIIDFILTNTKKYSEVFELLLLYSRYHQIDIIFMYYVICCILYIDNKYDLRDIDINKYTLTSEREKIIFKSPLLSILSVSFFINHQLLGGGKRCVNLALESRNKNFTHLLYKKCIIEENDNYTLSEKENNDFDDYNNIFNNKEKSKQEIKQIYKQDIHDQVEYYININFMMKQIKEKRYYTNITELDICIVAYLRTLYYKLYFRN